MASTVARCLQPRLYTTMNHDFCWMRTEYEKRKIAELSDEAVLKALAELFGEMYLLDWIRMIRVIPNSLEAAIYGLEHGILHGRRGEGDLARHLLSETDNFYTMCRHPVNYFVKWYVGTLPTSELDGMCLRDHLRAKIGALVDEITPIAIDRYCLTALERNGPLRRESDLSSDGRRVVEAAESSDNGSSYKSSDSA